MYVCVTPIVLNIFQTYDANETANLPSKTNGIKTLYITISKEPTEAFVNFTMGIDGCFERGEGFAHFDLKITYLTICQEANLAP